MGRSGYSDDCDDEGLLHLWRQAVSNAIHGARGQKFLRDLVTALDAIPDKRLIAEELEADGQVCAIGSVGKLRGIPMEKIDPYDTRQLSEQFGIARALAKEIMFENDEGAFTAETPEARWQRMRDWAMEHIIKETITEAP